MLDSIQLINFRRFDNHLIRFRPTTVVVGANNAGKSTIIEAIRLVSLVANRHGNLNFTKAPDWIDAPAAGFGVSPSLRDLNTNLATVVNTATGPPAQVVAKFTEGQTVHIYVSSDDAVFAAVWNDKDRLITSKAVAASNRLPRVAVQPQAAPLLLHEKVLDPRTIRRGLDSPLAPQHFRNQLRLLQNDDFETFKELSEDTWPTLEIQELLGGRQGEIDDLTLLVRDRAFVGEVGNMGHGLQMWLQTMWFLARNKDAPTIVLDEPDVYMHPDLQRRLVRTLRSNHRQVVVATHSVEIMAEADPADVLVVDADLPESPWAAGVAGLQTAISAIGGVHNLDLARLVSAKRFLMVEGDDIDYLRRPFDRLFPSEDPLDVMPKQSVGGWSGWQQAIGASTALVNASGEAITTYCIFDSDYHHPGEISKRLSQASTHGVNLHIWARKELENYFVVPEVVARVVAARAAAGSGAPTVDEIESAIDAACVQLRDRLLDNYAETYRLCHRRSSVPKARRWAVDYLDQRLSAGAHISHLVGGKELASALSTWSTDHYRASFGVSDLAIAMTVDEVPEELASVLAAIQSIENFDRSYAQAWTALPEEFHLSPDP